MAHPGPVLDEDGTLTRSVIDDNGRGAPGLPCSAQLQQGSRRWGEL